LEKKDSTDIYGDRPADDRFATEMKILEKKEVTDFKYQKNNSE
jgi:hypothetical protein